MIRKVIIVILSMTAIATLALGVASHCTDVWLYDVLVSKPTFGVTVLFPSAVSHGFCLDFAFVNEGMQPAKHKLYGNLKLGIMTTSFPGSNYFDWSEPGSGPGPDKDPSRPPGTAKWMGFFFTWWVAFIVLSAYPVAAFIRGPLRRRKKGLCIHCGYNLRGNVTGICPECSTPFEPTRSPGKDG